MMKNQVSILPVLIYLLVLPAMSVASDSNSLIQNVVTHLKDELPSMKSYGTHQKVVVTKLNEDGKAKRIEEKNLQTVWHQNEPKNELIRYHCKELEERSGKMRPCSNIQKINYDKKANSGRIESEVKKIRWTELHRSFHFRVLPSENSLYVIGFSPNKSFSPSNRIEKLLNRMEGKIWVDRNFNVVKAEANLVDTVSFGLGIAARVQQLAIHYKQQSHQDVWLPSALTIDLKAKVALLHTERQRIEVFWEHPYDRATREMVQVNTETAPVGGSRR